MKLKKQYCLLFSLVSLLSACSTTSQNSDQSQVAVNNETSSTKVIPSQVAVNNDVVISEVVTSEVVTSEVVPSPVVNEKQSLDAGVLRSQAETIREQNERLNSKDQKISRLEESLAQNKKQITQLNSQLDTQEETIARLETTIVNTRTARLVEIEQEKVKLNQLEAQYISLKLENENLNRSLNKLKIENRQYKEQILIHELMAADSFDLDSNNAEEIEMPTVADVSQDLSLMGLQSDYDALGKMHHALLHKYSTLDDDYQTLDRLYLEQENELARLKSKYKALDSANRKTKSDYTNLRQKNLDLGGAISDARSQQQHLWDQIQVKNKVITSIEADNAALREKSTSLENLTSGQVTATLPVVDNSFELGTLNAKILVLESEISAQKALLTEYQDKLTNLEQSDDKSDLKNIEIARLGQALVDLNADYKELNYQFEQLELAQGVSREQQHALLQKLTTAEENVTNLAVHKTRLETDLTQAQAELVSLQDRYEASLLALESAKGTRQSLETQLSDLIELEAISAGLKSHLTTNLSNVLWQIPKQVELGSSFEIILNANVNDGQAGQIFIAELITDSSLELVSSISAEAQASNGILQWRWRAKGVSESQMAQVNLFIHQEIQYQEDRVLREVYRDQQVLSLINDNLFEKYGFWMIAIFAGLMGGFMIGKLNKSNPS